MYLKSQAHFQKNFQFSGTKQKPAHPHRLSISIFSPISLDIFEHHGNIISKGVAAGSQPK
jgi:hypothetical protein